VMTDFIFGMRDAKKAALAGQDLEMPFQLHYSRYLKELVEEGEVPIERIDDACLRLLRQQVRFGQGRYPHDYGPETVGSEASRQLAREAAQKGIVLLKNEGSLLPLKGVKRLVVVGRLADTPNIGDAGSSNTLPDYVVTPLQGLRAALGGDVEIVYDDGSDAQRAASAVRGADAVLCVVGYTHLDEGELVSADTMPAFAPYFPEPTPEEEPIVAALMQGMMDAPIKQEVENGAFGMGGDRSMLTLHPEEEKLILAVAAANPNTVVAIMGGSAVITEAWRQAVPAMLMLWYPGMEGGHALADVLLGKLSPSGKLPCTFAKRVEDLPFYDKDATKITYDLWHGYRKLERDGVEPAFPFGFGLSYTTFAYSNLKLDQAELRSGDTLVATVDVTNTGGVAGDEVVQLYAAARGSAVERAKKELKAFARVSLQPGETKTVKLAVPVADLAYYGAAGWVVEPIEYTVIVGRHALDGEALQAPMKVER
jgi:beta-glucosidase